MSRGFNTTLSALSDTEKLGKALAQAISTMWANGVIIYLVGDLGAGKTTLSRYIIQGLGHKGNVKSPTYTLVEPYSLTNGHINHFDLYRLANPEELEFMGVRDYFQKNTLSIIEWPERGANYLAPPDLMITLKLETSRETNMEAKTQNGEIILNKCRHTFGH